MQLSEIQTFVAVGESGSVNRAARVLHLSQPAVTRRVQQLEAALGVTLLDRRARPPTLTQAGKRVLEQSRNVLAAVEALRAAVTPGEGPTGELRLGMVSSLADVVLAETAEHLRRRFPRLVLRLTTAWSQPLLAQVRQAALDAAVVYLPEDAHPPASTEGRKIATIPLSFVAARGRRMAGAVDLAEVLEEDWVLNPEGCAFRAALRRMLDGVHAPLRVAVEAHGVDLQLSLVAREVGLGFVPGHVLRQSRVRSKLRAFRVRGHDVRLAVWMVHGQLSPSLVPVVTALNARFARALLGG